MTKTIEITCDQCDKPLMGLPMFEVFFKSQLMPMNQELHFCSVDHIIQHFKKTYKESTLKNKVDYLGLYD